jgi:hypothetical protein
MDKHAIHTELLQGKIEGFLRWKHERTNLSYFHRRILSYPYKVRYVLLKTIPEHFYKIHHPGWPNDDFESKKLTVSAWSIKELFQLVQLPITIDYLKIQDIQDALTLIHSTFIPEEEVEELWFEYLKLFDGCQCRPTKQILMCNLLCALVKSSQEPSNPFHTLEYSILNFLDEGDKKIDLMKELFPSPILDAFLQWIYEEAPIPPFVRQFTMSWVDIHSASSL